MKVTGQGKSPGPGQPTSPPFLLSLFGGTPARKKRGGRKTVGDNGTEMLKLEDKLRTAVPTGLLLS